MSTSSADLAELLSRIAKSDRPAFAELYRATHLKLFGITLRILRQREVAEEVLQEVYVRIWDHAPDFRPGKASPITWMAAIARNRALDEVRRARPRIDDKATAVEMIADTGTSPLDRLVSNDDLSRLERCLEKLEDVRRTAVRLAYLDGLSRKELADRLDMPVGTIKTWLHRSLKELKDCLGS